MDIVRFDSDNRYISDGLLQFELTEVQPKFRASIFELKQKVDFNQELDVIFGYKRVLVTIMQTQNQTNNTKDNGILIRKRYR